jgi:hypothetical protein
MSTINSNHPINTIDVFLGAMKYLIKISLILSALKIVFKFQDWIRSQYTHIAKRSSLEVQYILNHERNQSRLHYKYFIE